MGLTPTQHFVNECIAKFRAEHDMASNSGLQKLERLLQSAEAPKSKEVCWNWRQEQLPILKAIKNRRLEACCLSSGLVWEIMPQLAPRPPPHLFTPPPPLARFL